ncbi:hypothetical protein B0H10DRAFT_1967124 [Mycena sp. CBHHK59/15]|nr:hypothetical protein B0H10DRAFT_1967124 [Mycena sp. CBHHK59/15]
MCTRGVHIQNYGFRDPLRPKDVYMYAGCQFYTVAVAPVSKAEEEAFLNVYNDCNIPLDVLSGLLSPSSSSATLANFSVNEDGGLACAGHAENSDAEAKDAAPVALGRGQHKKMGMTYYQGSLWEEH